MSKDTIMIILLTLLAIAVVLFFAYYAWFNVTYQNMQLEFAEWLLANGEHDALDALFRMRDEMDTASDRKLLEAKWKEWRATKK